MVKRILGAASQEVAEDSNWNPHYESVSRAHDGGVLGNWNELIALMGLDDTTINTKKPTEIVQ